MVWPQGADLSEKAISGCLPPGWSSAPSDSHILRKGKLACAWRLGQRMPPCDRRGAATSPPPWPTLCTPLLCPPVHPPPASWLPPSCLFSHSSFFAVEPLWPNHLITIPPSALPSPPHWVAQPQNFLHLFPVLPSSFAGIACTVGGSRQGSMGQSLGLLDPRTGNIGWRSGFASVEMVV